jgi:hypothetical protein
LHLFPSSYRLHHQYFSNTPKSRAAPKLSSNSPRSGTREDRTYINITAAPACRLGAVGNVSHRLRGAGGVGSRAQETGAAKRLCVRVEVGLAERQGGGGILSESESEEHGEDGGGEGEGMHIET